MALRNKICSAFDPENPFDLVDPLNARAELRDQPIRASILWLGTYMKRMTGLAGFQDCCSQEGFARRSILKSVQSGRSFKTLVPSCRNQRIQWLDRLARHVPEEDDWIGWISGSLFT